RRSVFRLPPTSPASRPPGARSPPRSISSGPAASRTWSSCAATSRRSPPSVVRRPAPAMPPPSSPTPATAHRAPASRPGPIPAPLAARLEALGDDPEGSLAVAVEWTTKQCVDLLRGGAPGIHFYTLNQSPATRAIFENLRRDGLVAR